MVKDLFRKHWNIAIETLAFKNYVLLYRRKILKQLKMLEGNSSAFAFYLLSSWTCSSNKWKRSLNGTNSLTADRNLTVSAISLIDLTINLKVWDILFWECLVDLQNPQTPVVFPQPSNGCQTRGRLSNAEIHLWWMGGEVRQLTNCYWLAP